MVQRATQSLRPVVQLVLQTDPGGPKVAYRNEKVEEAEHPEQPGVKLRRTTIDEVIVQRLMS